VSCYEAGYDGFWLHRLLLAGGITNHVFDPSSIAVDQRAWRMKTDRIDGEKMLRTLMASAWRARRCADRARADTRSGGHPPG
jgi:transposase